MNAAPEEVEQKIPDTLSKYFTLDTDFNPVGVSKPTPALCGLTSISPLLQGLFYGEAEEHEESEWEVKDYITGH